MRPSRRTVALSLLLSTCTVAASPAASEDAGDARLSGARARGLVLPVEEVAGAVAAPVLDGDLGEWGDMRRGAALLSQRMDRTGGPDSPDRRDGALVRLRRDVQAIYVAVRVSDAVVSNPHPPHLGFQGDCVELFFDLRDAYGADGRYAPGVCQLLLLPPLPDGTPARWRQPANGPKLTGDIAVAGRAAPGGYALEARIPLESLFRTPGARLARPFGFDVQIDDLDGAAGPASAYAWAGGGSAWEDATRFGVAEPVAALPASAPVTRLWPASLKGKEGAWSFAAGVAVAGGATAPEWRLGWRHARGAFEGGAGAGKPKLAERGPRERHEIAGLGVAVERAEAAVEAVQPGRYYLRTEVTGAAAPSPAPAPALSHFYALEWEHRTFLEPADPLPPARSDDALLTSLASANTQVLLEDHYPAAGRRGALRGVFTCLLPSGLLWALSEREGGAYRARVSVVRPGEKGAARPLAGVEVPYRVGPVAFSLPVAGLPAGEYRVTAAAVGPEGRTRPVSRADEFEGRPYTYTPDVPLVVTAKRRETTWPGGVKDAAPLLTRAARVGSPSRARYPKDDAADSQARSVWDLFAFGGRVYVGAGDWNANRGPIDIWSFAPTAGSGGAPEFRKEFTVDDESVNVFREIDGRLYVPGMDAREPNAVGREWDWGNVYVKDGPEGSWKKHRSVPNGLHVFDVAAFGGRLYATGGTETGAGLFESADGGATWRRVPAEDAEAEYAEFRYWDLAPLGDRLLVMPTRGQLGAFQVRKGGGFTRLAAPLFPDLPLTAATVSQKPFRTQAFGGAVLYTDNYAADVPNEDRSRPAGEPRRRLYVMRDPEEGGRVVAAFEKAWVQDILVRDGECHILSAETDGSGYFAVVHTAGPDLKTWTRRARARVPALPHSLERLGGSYYVGLASRPGRALTASGDIYRLE